MKTITFKSVLAVLIALFSLNANAYDVYIDGIYYNLSRKTRTAEVTYGKYPTNVVIPESFEYEGITYTVTAIEDGAFSYLDANMLLLGDFVTSIKIPKTIKTMGSNAFRGCENITSLIIPNSVTEIGFEAFRYCHNLPSVQVPSSVKVIGGRAFQECYELASVDIGEGIEEIGSYAFYRCYGLNSVICYAANVPSTDSDAFVQSNYTSATLYVPSESVGSYKAADPWSGFGNIVALPEGTGIGNTIASGTAMFPTGIYNFKGEQQKMFQKGVNIIRMSDGTTKKIYVK